MAEALEAGYDLGALALCFLAIGLLLAAKDLVRVAVAVFDVSILGYRPFHSIARALENSVIGALDSAIKGVEGQTARFENGLIDAFGLFVGIPILLGLGVKVAFEYLWTSALRPVIHSIVDPVATRAAQALAKVEALSGVVSANLAAAERYAREKADAALADARGYADAKIAAATGVLRAAIPDAIGVAERYADQAVGKLRTAEDAAIGAAVELAVNAKAAGVAAAGAALAEAERVAGRELSAAEAEATRALATAQALSQAAIADVRSIAVTAEDELAKLEQLAGATGLAALIAAMPAVATLVHAIASEAGLENAECRTKVKGICRTDPSAWENLLSGLVAVGFAFSLAELAHVARPLAEELAPIIRKAA